jgi:hypothetical protein
MFFEAETTQQPSIIRATTEHCPCSTVDFGTLLEISRMGSSIDEGRALSPARVRAGRTTLRRKSRTGILAIGRWVKKTKIERA